MTESGKEAIRADDGRVASTTLKAPGKRIHKRERVHGSRLDWFSGAGTASRRTPRFWRQCVRSSTDESFPPRSELDE